MIKRAVTLLLSLSLAVCVLTSVADAPTAAGTVPPRSSSFRDIEGHIGKSAIEKWTGYGIISGRDEANFRPDSTISRAEMAAMLVRLIGYSALSTQQPRDVRTSDWYYDDIMKVTAANVMTGYNGYVWPNALVTREEAVTLIARAFNIPNNLSGRRAFDDWDNISGWAKGSVINMWARGHLDFLGERFIPQGRITRAETVMIIDAMFAAFYAHPGVYTGTVDGNIIIRSPGVTLRNARIKGDVYIVEGVGDGFYTIDDKTIIEGRVFMRSGRENPHPHIDPYAPIVALTFDDGPSASTGRILDALEAYGARATFFVLGGAIGPNIDTLRRAVSLGCELAGHSWSHADMTSMNAESLIGDTQRVNDAIFEAARVRPVLVRPPYGSYNSATVRTLGSIGMSVVYWSVDPQDWAHNSSNTTYTRIISSVSDGAIIILHDTVPSTAVAVERLVPELVARGYQLITVSEMLVYSEIGLEPGIVYTSKHSYK